MCNRIIYTPRQVKSWNSKWPTLWTKNVIARHRTPKLQVYPKILLMCLSLPDIKGGARLAWLRIVVAILKCKMEALSYKILIAIIQICYMGIISLPKKHDNPLSPDWYWQPCLAHPLKIQLNCYLVHTVAVLHGHFCVTSPHPSLSPAPQSVAPPGGRYVQH